MDQQLKINEDVIVGPQPTVEKLKELAADEVGSVIDLRSYDDDAQPLPPRDEGVRVQELGMDYLSIPVAKEDLSARQVDDFRIKLDLVEKPVFVHCKSGKRSGTLAMMDHAVRQGWTGEKALDKAEEMGLECGAPDVKEFVKSYVDGKSEKHTD